MALVKKLNLNGALSVKQGEDVFQPPSGSRVIQWCCLPA